MAITNAQLAALADLTPANMLLMWKQAEAAVAMTGQAYTTTGRSLTRANLAEIRNAIIYWQGVVNSADEGGGGNVLVQFGEPQ
jgi:hypothetical protein